MEENHGGCVDVFQKWAPTGSREKWGHVSSILELTEVQFRKSNSVSPIPAAECPPLQHKTLFRH